MSANKTRFLNKDEIERLLANCPEPHIYLFITLAINTGARKGELLDLKWDQVDFENKIIYLNPEGREQTSKRRAIVPMNDLLYGTLVKTKLAQEKYVRDKSEETGTEIALCGHVIAYNNQPLQGVRTGFRRSCERAKIKGVTPHTLRHTAGTLMALAGIDLFLIAKVLGHSVQKTTEMYAHFQPEYLRGAVDVLPDSQNNTASKASELGQIVSAFFEISQGHPLHLIYSFEALVKRGTIFTPDETHVVGC